MVVWIARVPHAHSRNRYRFVPIVSHEFSICLPIFFSLLCTPRTTTERRMKKENFSNIASESIGAVWSINNGCLKCFMSTRRKHYIRQVNERTRKTKDVFHRKMFRVNKLVYKLFEYHWEKKKKNRKKDVFPTYSWYCTNETKKDEEKLLWILPMCAFFNWCDLLFLFWRFSITRTH